MVVASDRRQRHADPADGPRASATLLVTAYRRTENAAQRTQCRPETVSARRAKAEVRSWRVVASLRSAMR